MLLRASTYSAGNRVFSLFPDTTYSISVHFSGKRNIPSRSVFDVTNHRTLVTVADIERYCAGAYRIDNEHSEVQLLLHYFFI